MKHFTITSLVFLALIFTSCGDSAKKENTVTTEQAKQIAEDAYIYAYPMIEHYKMIFVTAIYKESEAYTGPFNIMTHNSTLLGPEYTAIVRPNNDTYYSNLWLNLTSEPMVLTVPVIEALLFVPIH